MKVVYKASAVKGKEESVTVTARNHTITVDEPVEKGGTDLGMNPVELLLGSIAACLTLTISIYSEAYQIKIDEIRVDMEGDLDSAGMKGSARVRPGYSNIRPHIMIRTDATKEIMQQVVDLAVLRCPVEDSVCKGVPFQDPELIVKNA